MSDINEAYARIDYKFLKDLDVKIDSLEERLDDLANKVSVIGGRVGRSNDLVIYSNKRIFSRSGSGTATLSFSFGSIFKKVPDVCLTPALSGETVPSNLPTICIVSTSVTEVKFVIEGGQRSTRVHCIAIGE